MFETMFERATVFSAILVFLIFGFVSKKYFQIVEARNQDTPTISTSSQK